MDEKREEEKKGSEGHLCHVVSHRCVLSTGKPITKVRVSWELTIRCGSRAKFGYLVLKRQWCILGTV